MEISTPIQSILSRKGAEVWSVAPDDTVLDAISRMAMYDVGALPVLQGGRLLGMISERDYTRKIILFGRSSRDTSVAEIMTRDPIVVEPGDSVQDCMQLMTDNRVRHLPVMAGGIVVGMLSIGDVVNWIIGAQDAALAEMEKFVTGAYPG